MRFKFAAAVSVALLLVTSSAYAKDFKTWLSALRAEARSKGISEAVIAEALPDSLTPIKRIVELDRKQPEKTKTFEQYLDSIVSADRIEKGRTRYLNNRSLLDEVGNAYGVHPEVIVALWGIETNYGQNTGGFDVITALATLAYDGRRADFFRTELMKALQILDEGHISHANMKGSWAGAMGQSQFMPSSFLNFAQDYNKDGRRDIWTTQADVFASAANYLSKSGWKSDEPWGREVHVPAGLDRNLVSLDVTRKLQFWHDKGVRLKDGRSSVPFEGAYYASIVQPGGPGTRAFLVYDNYRVIMKWNKSQYFATSVGLLSDRIAESKARAAAPMNN